MFCYLHISAPKRAMTADSMAPLEPSKLLQVVHMTSAGFLVDHYLDLYALPSHGYISHRGWTALQQVLA